MEGHCKIKLAVELQLQDLLHRSCLLLSMRSAGLPQHSVLPPDESLHDRRAMCFLTLLCATTATSFAWLATSGCPELLRAMEQT